MAQLVGSVDSFHHNLKEEINCLDIRRTVTVDKDSRQKECVERVMAKVNSGVFGNG